MSSVVIIPTYNESENIEKLSNGILALKKDVSVIIVDDNSPDGTGLIADRLAGADSAIKVIHRQGKLGLGTAYIAGFKYALKENFEYILTMDADFSHDPERIPQLIDEAKRCDVVIGSRYIKGGDTVNWSIYRRMLSKTANMVTKFMLRLKPNDCTSGFRCYNRNVLESLKLDTLFSSGYSFLVEVLYEAQSMGYRIGEVPIIFNDRKRGKSKISKKEIFKGAYTIFRLSAKRLIKGRHKDVS